MEVHEIVFLLLSSIAIFIVAFGKKNTIQGNTKKQQV